MYRYETWWILLKMEGVTCLKKVCLWGKLRIMDTLSEI